MTIPSTSATTPRRTPSPTQSASPSRPAAREAGVALERPQDAPASSRPMAAQGPMAPRGAIPPRPVVRPAAQPVVTTSLSTPAAASRSPGAQVDPNSVVEIARRLHAADIQRLEHLAEVQAELAAGGSGLETRRRTGLDRTVVANHFDGEGRLLISQAVERTLMTRGAAGHVQRLASLPRALRPDDVGRLMQVLQDNPGATDPQLRAAARAADVSKAALKYLFDAGTPLRERLLTLPGEQHADLVAAHAPPAPAEAPAGAPAPTRARTEAQTDARTDPRTEARTEARARARARTEALAAARAAMPAQAQAQTQAPTRPTVLDPLHRRHLEETRRFEQVANAHLSIMQGHGFRAAAAASGLPEQVVANAFSAQGHLLLNAAGEGLARTPDEATARRFAALPRALDESDMSRLAELLQALPRVSDALLRESSARVGVSPQAVAHLFDAGVPLRERIATLPAHQRTALEAALAGSPPPALEPAHESPPQPLELAQDRPAPPGAGLSQADREFLERHLFGESDGSPVASPQGSPSLPELSQTEIDQILRSLETPPPSPHAEPPQGASTGVVSISTGSAGIRSEEAPRTSAPPATGLSQEIMEIANQFLRQETEHAQRFAQAQALLAGGASLGQAAKAIGAHASTVGNSFSEQGHLLLTQAAERLLLARDPANAQPFAALPRALTRSDLALLGRVMRENPDASDAQLHIAAIGAKVSRRAIAHLFNTGEPLRQRIATLPAEQQQSLGIAVPAQPPHVASPRTRTVVHSPAPVLPASPPEEPVAANPWELPLEDDEMDAILAQLNLSPVRSPVAGPAMGPATGRSPAVEERGDASPPAPAASPGRNDETRQAGAFEPVDIPTWGARGPRSRPVGGLPDPGTPPWAQLEEPISPAGEALLDLGATPPHTPAMEPPRKSPPATGQAATASPLAWGGTQPRTTQTRPRPMDPGPSSSSAASKRRGEELQAPAAQRPRRGDTAASTAQGLPDLQNLRWGGQGPRTRPAPRAQTPGTDSSSD